MAKPKPVPDATLEPFEGIAVASSTVVIRRAGDGLSESVKVDPVTLHKGERVFVVLETVVGEVGFKPIKDTAMVTRKHELLTEVATIVDGELVREVMDAQRARIEEAKAAQQVADERAEGVRTLADGEEEVGRPSRRSASAGIPWGRTVTCTCGRTTAGGCAERASESDGGNGRE